MLCYSSEGEEKAKLKYVEPFSIGFEAIAKSNYKDLSIVVDVESVSGMRIFTSIGKSFGMVFSVSPEVPLKASVSFGNLVLTPGLYQLS